MSVLIVTSLGDIVIDLYSDRCPLTAKNFLKLCKIKYYNGCLFHTIQKDFTAQTGDPTGTGTGGDSIYKFLYGEQARFFSDEIHLDLKHAKTGTVAMASGGENLNASQFYFTLREDLDYLDGKHTVFGEVAEGLETLTRINEAYVDEKGRPYKNIRIKHTYILDDPFDDPSQLPEFIPEASPEGKPKDEIDVDVRLEDDWVPMDETLGPQELEEIIRAKDAHSSAVVLESIGDIPDADMKPPENVLFVCKLNPVTEDEDLHTIFSRFGPVSSAEVIRDFKTGDSLCYAFIEFENKESCEQAYFKMDNALIDDRRIHVDFSQSVSKLWSQYRRKEHKTGKGNGCFKCGADDHIAKDCTGGTAIPQHQQKYILKDDNPHRGGGDKSRYDMVFDEDIQESPKQDKRNRSQDPDERAEKQKMEWQKLEESRHRDQEKRDSRHGHRQAEKSDRDHRDGELRRERDGREGRHGGSRSSRDYVEEQNREKHKDRRNEQDEKRVGDRDYSKKSAGNGRHEERRDDKYHRKATDDDRPMEQGEDRDYRKRSADNDSRAERRDVGDFKKRNENHRGHSDKRDDRDYRKNDVHDPGDERRDRKRGADGDGYRDRREDREHKRQETGSADERDRERRYRHDKRR
ncbi:peptidyl-prolyl cis-trans isomerase CYP59 [Humulus lupulus]|uniref:peptidyl-prolyl cis-trans isomerase CYP59 n=1 Tax=Humulus lupulus TaxID=3486 RepID=UPI002B414FC2|nr:peptidyl-prolyl cis-trans isomerase CYP59 [Humulus lupulus]